MPRGNQDLTLSRFLRKENGGEWLVQGISVLAAVSGGVDSVVLLDLLVQASVEKKFALGVAHINHGRRGKEGDADARFVQSLANRYALPCRTMMIPKYGGRYPGGWEAYARRWRYSRLEAARRRMGFDWIATGHHADDQVETILMRVTEGTGTPGLQGIRRGENRVIRPLLRTSREAIEHYARKHNLSHREDSTNRDISFRRNFVRARVVPLLKQLNPSLVEGIARLVANASDTEEALAAFTERCVAAAARRREDGSWVISKSELDNFPRMVQLRAVRELCGNGEDWRHHDWRQLSAFLGRAGTGTLAAVPGNWELLCDREAWILREQRDRKRNSVEISLQRGKRKVVQVGSFRLTVRSLSERRPRFQDGSVAMVDGKSLEGKRLVCRPWRAGDRFRPLGMTRFKKVSDYLVDRKVDRFAKDELCVLEAGGSIVWLCGMQVDDRFKVTPSTKTVLDFQWERGKE